MFSTGGIKESFEKATSVYIFKCLGLMSSDATRFSSLLSFNSGDKMTLIRDYPLVKSMHALTLSK